MAALICGSLAFDTIMSFEGKFANQILPEQLHILNVSFLVPSLRRDFGGCAGNIAYSLKLLGGQPLPMATVGEDGASYLGRMRTLGIETRYVRQLDDTYTAQAMIMTDSDNNQITAFHPGAMTEAHVNVIDGSEGAAVGIVSLGGRAGTRLAAAFPVEESDDLMLVTDGGQMIRTPVSQVRIVGRSSQGVTIFRTGKDEKVVSVERLADTGGDDEDGDTGDAPAVEGGEV